MHYRFTQSRIPSHALLLVVMSLSACSTTSPPQAITPLPAINQEPARKALREADAAFAKLLEKKGPAQAFYQFLLPDGTVLLTGELPMKGRDAIRVHLSALPAESWVLKPLGIEVSASADLAYSWGEYEMRNKAAGAQSRIGYGKYVSVWKKLPDGSWKIAVHASSSSPGPTERR
jgi:ketosteroid isomerase-like protein